MDLSRSDWEYVDERAGAFVGREWVFAQVRSFLSGPPGTFLLRGDPGTGKTAVTARLAQASCGRLDAAGSLSPPVSEGTISAAVFCRAGKATVPELAQRLSDQLATAVDGFAEALRATAEPEHGITIGDVRVVVQGDVHAGGTVSGVVLSQQDGKLAFSMGVAVPLRRLRDRGAAEPIVLLVDAVDEAVDVGDVNAFSRLLSNLDGVHLIVTCRPDPRVLSDFKAAAHKLDLIADAPADDDDVRDYIRNRLGGQGPGEAVDVLVERVSVEADGNFLYAFYVTGTLTGSGSLAGLDEKAARGLPLPTGGLPGVYEDFLDRQIAGDEAKWAEQLSPVLAPLCVALGDGFTTAQLGAIATRLTGRDFSLSRARHVTRLAGQFLDGPHPDGPFRVYHQSFARFLTDPRQNPNWPIDLSETNNAVVRALMPEGQPGARDWIDASAYVRRHLAAHAAAAGIIDNLLSDDAYLLHADLRRLMQVADDATSADGRRRAQLLRMTPQAIVAGPGERVALFSVTEALENLGIAYREGAWHAPYRAQWASVRLRHERLFLEGHQNEVYGVCPITIDGRELLASVGAGADGTVWIWDLQTGEPHAILEGHRGWVGAVCPVTVAGRQLLASAGADGTVRIWDPQTREPRATLESHQDEVNGICPVAVDGRQLLASAGADGTVRIWDPDTGEHLATLQGHQDAVNGVFPVTVADQELLASAGADGTVRIWDPDTGEHLATLQGRYGEVNGICTVTVDGRQLLAIAADFAACIWDPYTSALHAILQGHLGLVEAVCSVTVAGRELLASASEDHTVRIWDPDTGDHLTALEGHSDIVNAICTVTVAGQELLASAGADGTVRIWDPDPEHYAVGEGDTVPVNGVCTVTVAGQELLASASADHRVRIWDPHTGEPRATMVGNHYGEVNGVCPVTVDGRQLLASASADCTLWIWDPDTGEHLATLQGHQNGVNGVCTVTMAGQELLASAGADGTVRIWDPQTREPRATLEGHQNEVNGVCTVTMAGQELLASAGADGTVRIWDPQTREPRATLEGHQNEVNGVCTVTMAGQELLASAGADGTVRIWDPQTREPRATLEGHQNEVNGVCTVTMAGQELLASAGADRTVRIWDLQAGACLLTVPTHHTALGIVGIAGLLAVGLGTGILVIKPDAAA